jgi:hypothetical protein
MHIHSPCFSLLLTFFKTQVEGKSGLLYAALNEEIDHYDNYEILIVPEEEMLILNRQTKMYLRESDLEPKIKSISKSNHRKMAPLEESFKDMFSPSQEFHTELRTTDESSTSESTESSMEKGDKYRGKSQYTRKKEKKSYTKPSNIDDHYRSYRHCGKKSNRREQEYDSEEDDDKESREAKHHRQYKKHSSRDLDEHRRGNCKVKKTNNVYDSDDGAVAYKPKLSRSKTFSSVSSPRKPRPSSSRHQQQGN